MFSRINTTVFLQRKKKEKFSVSEHPKFQLTTWSQNAWMSFSVKIETECVHITVYYEQYE